MPRKSEPTSPDAPRVVVHERAVLAKYSGDPATACAYSLACRKCGAPVSYDKPDEPEGDTVACECGATNLVPEEVA